MTVQELINKLEKIENKGRLVYVENTISDFSCDNYTISEADKVIDSEYDDAYSEGIYIVGE